MIARLKGGEPLSPGGVFALDLEGDGNSPPTPVDLALVEIRDWNTTLGWRRWLFRPERPISRMATSIHGIRNKDVEGAPNFENSAQEIRSLVSGATVVGHNVRVDIDVLGRMLPGWQPNRAIDTLRLAKLLLPGRATYGLQSLAKNYDLAEGLEEQCDSSAHTSAYDALLAARLLFRLLELRAPEDRKYLLSSASIIEEPRQGSLF